MAQPKMPRGSYPAGEYCLSRPQSQGGQVLGLTNNEPSVLYQAIIRREGLFLEVEPIAESVPQLQEQRLDKQNIDNNGTLYQPPVPGPFMRYCQKTWWSQLFPLAPTTIVVAIVQNIRQNCRRVMQVWNGPLKQEPQGQCWEGGG